MELEKSTELEAQSGDQTGVVVPEADVPEGAEESRTAKADAGRGGVVDLNNPDFAMVDSDSGEADGAEDAPESDGAGRTEKKTQKQAEQSKEENAAIRAARLRAQREAETSAAAKADAAIAASGVVNPYTGRPFSGMQEFREYGQRVREASLAQQAQKTGRSVEELREEQANMAFLSAQRREAEQRYEQQRRTQAEAQAQAEFVANDLRDFVQRHPEVTPEQLGALEKNEQFLRFCGSRFKHEPLADLYDDYMEMVGAAGTAAVTKAKSRSERSTGSGTAGDVLLSPAQKRALDEWNSNNPDMKMTAKEFLGR